jgi:enamine deaminase RidA (YjgF/YER057c/UK114 family)
MPLPPRAGVLAISGQLPLDADGRLVGPSEPLAQAEQVFANLGLALEAAGASAADVIRLGFYVIDLADLRQIRSARDRFLGAGPPPASTLVQVSGLVAPGARLEVDALAVVPAEAR